jgi:tRNA(adenine34) deaminase
MHQKYMRLAISEAQQAYEQDETPVGAVLMIGDKVIARAHNLTETLRDATAHAEMQLIASAGSVIGSKYLTECILYVTIEPCPMCAAAMFWAQLGALVYGAHDPKRGYSLIAAPFLHPSTQVTAGILESECGALMSSFFKQKRRRLLNY